jgi:hypothetical protein
MRKIVFVLTVLMFIVVPCYAQEMKIRDIADVAKSFMPDEKIRLMAKSITTERKALKAVSDGKPTIPQEESFGVIATEMLDEHRSRATFITTSAVPSGVFFFKMMSLPDGTEVFLPGWQLEYPIQSDERYHFLVWDGDARSLSGGNGDIRVTIYAFNNTNGRLSVVHDMIPQWRGSAVYKSPRIRSVSSEGGTVRVRLDLFDGSKPTFVIEGRVVPTDEVAELGNGEFILFPPMWWEGEKALTVRSGNSCDSTRFRHFVNEKGATAPPTK